VELDTSLVMEHFTSTMQNFFVLIGVCTVGTFLLTCTYIYIVHHKGGDTF